MKKMHVIFLVIVQTFSSHAGDLIAGIEYGDNEDTVLKKLSNSDLVKSSLDKSIFARVGLNGSFTTTNTLNGRKFQLFFDWDRNGTSKALNQMTFRSSPMSMRSYNTDLKSSWLHGQTLLSAMFGKPTNAGDFPKLTKLPESGIIYSHAWKTSEGYIYLGIGKENARLNLSIGFHKKSLGGN